MRTFNVKRILEEEHIIVKKDTWKGFYLENCKSIFGYLAEEKYLMKGWFIQFRESTSGVYFYGFAVLRCGGS